jgi:purine nucleosidase/pyrimidine-specific ribonucleoside hydrolase
MARMLLKEYGRDDIVVCAGIDKPLVAPVLDRENDHYEKNGEFIPCQYLDSMEKEQYDNRHAVDFIIETVERFPDEITLVPIGPLTNIAVAIRKAPETMKRLKQITLMGGYFTKEVAEWNILCDPEAARIVFSSGIPVKAVGLDVTMQCRLENNILNELKLKAGDMSPLIFTMMNKWFEHYSFECPVLHDPLTIGTMVSDKFVVFKEEPVLVELDKANYGVTSLKQDTTQFGSERVQIAVSVDSEAYLKNFLESVF